MNSDQDKSDSDEWSRWLLSQRFGGGDAEYRLRLLQTLEPVRDRVLDHAHLAQQMTLMDVGSGDGLIPLGAIQRIGPTLKVIFSDISAALLRHAEQLAQRAEIDRQCEFVQASAEDLGAIAHHSIDVITSRSVLAYVGNKQKAFAEFFRVLRPGGRMSIAEPINQDFALETCAIGRFLAMQSESNSSKSLSLIHRFRSCILPSTEEAIREDPLTNFNERDLMQMARAVGFNNLHMELHITQNNDSKFEWDVFLDTPAHPGARSPREILEAQFSFGERSALENVLRPAIESSVSAAVSNLAYLSGQKPSPSRNEASMGPCSEEHGN